MPNTLSLHAGKIRFFIFIFEAQFRPRAQEPPSGSAVVTSAAIDPNRINSWNNKAPFKMMGESVDADDDVDSAEEETADIIDNWNDVIEGLLSLCPRHVARFRRQS